MKNLSILTLIQALLSLVSGILISKMSFIGKIGVSTFYSQYAVFKTWWKTALILFIVQFVLLLFLQTFRAKVSIGFAPFVGCTINNNRSRRGLSDLYRFYHYGS